MPAVVSGDGSSRLSASRSLSFSAALAVGSEAARRSRFQVYPDAPHAFHADYRPSYRKAEAEDGWKRALEHLAKALA